MQAAAAGLHPFGEDRRGAGVDAAAGMRQAVEGEECERPRARGEGGEEGEDVGGGDGGHVAGQNEHVGTVVLQGGANAADGSRAGVRVGNDEIREIGDVRVGVADNGDARAEDRAEGVDGPQDERAAVVERLAELVASEPRAASADEHGGEDPVDRERE